MSKKNVEEVRLLIARLLNEENDTYAKSIKDFKVYSDLTSAQQLLETLTYTHKAKVELLEQLYREI